MERSEAAVIMLPGLGSLKGEIHLLNSPLGTTKIRRNSYVEKHLFLLFILVKFPESILDLEYLFFNQIYP